MDARTLLIIFFVIIVVLAVFGTNFKTYKRVSSPRRRRKQPARAVSYDNENDEDSDLDQYGPLFTGSRVAKKNVIRKRKDNDDYV